MMNKLLNEGYNSSEMNDFCWNDASNFGVYDDILMSIDVWLCIMHEIHDA